MESCITVSHRTPASNVSEDHCSWGLCPRSASGSPTGPSFLSASRARNASGLPTGISRPPSSSPFTHRSASQDISQDSCPPPSSSLASGPAIGLSLSLFALSCCSSFFISHFLRSLSIRVSGVSKEYSHCVKLALESVQTHHVQ